MTAYRGWIFATVAALAVAGCSSAPDDEASKSARASSSSPAPGSPAAKPRATPVSAFCRDLDPYKVSVVAFQADVTRSLRGEPLDIGDLRRRAAALETMGDGMEAGVPPDIAGSFGTVRRSIDKSASKLTPVAKVRDLVDTMSSERVSLAVNDLVAYECGAGAG
ncbi:hypothetical protein [Streptomyces sp. MAR4 CNX-425]|uniref:hypothetical protein n=1 Tax=Streptomyces sp. MAR4 CNX-425 TaxID=3406343 RepID=UPI003B50B585